LTQFQRDLVAASARHRARCQRSSFFTGFLSAVFQPFFFQPWIQLGDAVAQILAVGVQIDGAGLFQRSSAEIAAISSMRLLVVWASPPFNSFSACP
jgi:predicted deacylase